MNDWPAVNTKQTLPTNLLPEEKSFDELSVFSVREGDR